MSIKSEIENGYEPARATGKTFARTLISIAEALLCPGEWFCVVDHYGGTDANTVKEMLENAVKAFGLEMDVTIYKNRAYIRSMFPMNHSL